jgi:cell division protein FtsB
VGKNIVSLQIGLFNIDNMEDKIKKLEKAVRKHKTLNIVLALVALFAVCFSLFYTKEKIVEIQTVQEQHASLQDELDSILREYEAIKKEYGELNEQLSEKDSAILAQAAEIKALIASHADYRRIKKKLELLQDQGKHYVHMLDSLYTVNRELMAENQEIKKEVSRLHTQQQTLSEEKEVLTEKVTVASRVKGYGFAINGIVSKSGGKKEELTSKARKVEQFKVTFTLAENPLAEAGEVNLYCRISLPDGRVLSMGTGDGYSFLNDGKRLQYTMKSTVNYDTKSKSVTMVWQLPNGDSAVPGEYTAQIFSDTDFLGEATLALLK